MTELRRSYAISHQTFTYDLEGSFIKPFIIGRDDKTGDSISDKKEFSEMRGYYWLWRNHSFPTDEFVSIQQYRRCFWFPQLMQGVGGELAKINSYLCTNTHLPTFTCGRQTYINYMSFLKETDLSPLNEWLSGVDLVVNRHLIFNGKLVRQLYGENHRADDWEVLAHVLRKYGYNDGRFDWLTTHTVYIWTPQLFYRYMEDWWQVMSEVHSLVSLENDPYQHRKMAFMSEWFMSMWLIKQRIERPTLRVQTLPILEGLFQLDRQGAGAM